MSLIRARDEVENLLDDKERSVKRARLAADHTFLDDLLAHDFHVGQISLQEQQYHLWMKSFPLLDLLLQFIPEMWLEVLRKCRTKDIYALMLTCASLHAKLDALRLDPLLSSVCWPLDHIKMREVVGETCSVDSFTHFYEKGIVDICPRGTVFVCSRPNMFLFALTWGTAAFFRGLYAKVLSTVEDSYDADESSDAEEDYPSPDSVLWTSSLEFLFLMRNPHFDTITFFVECLHISRRRSAWIDIADYARRSDNLHLLQQIPKDVKIV